MSKLRAARLTGSKASHIGITRGILGQRLRNAGLARQSESRNPPRRAGSPLHLLHPPSRTLYPSLFLPQTSPLLSSMFSSPPRFFLSLSTVSSPIQFLFLLLLFTLPFLPLRLRTSGAMRSLRAFVRPTPISLPPLSPLSSRHSSSVFLFLLRDIPIPFSWSLGVPHVDIHAALFACLSSLSISVSFALHLFVPQRYFLSIIRS